MTDELFATLRRLLIRSITPRALPMPPSQDEAFDPYLQWLGIRDPVRPPNAYRLLGIELFESDPDVIQTAADRQMSHLRTFQHGKNSERSQALLNEVAAARVLLLDEERKATYDRELSAPQAVSSALATDSTKPGDNLLLNTPGRGRGERPWYYWVALASPMLLICVVVIGYQFLRSAWHNKSAQVAIRQAQEASGNPAEDRTDPATESDAGTDPEDSASDNDPASVPPEETDSPPASPDDDPANKPVAEAGTDDDPSTPAEPVDDTGASGDSRGPDDWVTIDTDSRLTNWSQLPPYSDETAALNSSTPLGQFMITLSQRRLDSAAGMLRAIQQNAALTLESEQRMDAELVLSAANDFWSRVALGSETIAIGDHLNYRGMDVIVRTLDGQTAELITSTGDPQSFTLDVSQMDLSLAAALAERASLPNTPVVWRMAALIYAVDSNGSLWTSREYARRANAMGSSPDFLLRAVRRLQGRPVLPAPKLDEQPLTSMTAENGATSADSAAQTPSRDDQLAARRAVLSPESRRLREAKIPRERHGAEMYARAADPELNRAEVYVLLKSALSRATTYQDLDTAWAAIERLESQFGENGSDLRYRALERMARRLKGEARRPYANLAHQLSIEAMYRDDYDAASTLSSLAQAIAKPMDDEDFTGFMLRVKQHVLAAKDQYGRLEQVRERLRKNPQDGWARTQLARFDLLTKGNFSQLAAHRTAAPPKLRELIEAELQVGQLPQRQTQLGDAWLRFGRTLQGVEKQVAFERARHWFEQALPDLETEAAATVQASLAEIATEIGRTSSRVDLTRLKPVSTKVGYGRLGTNSNPDVGEGPVKGVPEIAGRKIRRFFWACAPSSLRFVVDQEAAGFRATGFVNADSKDGVRFLVLANDQTVFESPIVKQSTPVEIDAVLPKGTTTLELKVDPVNNPVFDHAYWVDPIIMLRPVKN